MIKLSLALVFVSTVGHADPGWDGGIVYQMGTFPIGTQSNTALGSRLEGGMHVGRLAFLGEYTFYELDPSSTTATTSWSGRAHRFGATLRYHVPIDPFGTSLWGEVGAGVQLYGLTSSRSRDDVAVGLGWQRAFRTIRGDRHVGYFFAVRATQAPAPPDPTMPSIPASTTCRGTCPATSTAGGPDRSFLLTAGVVFGS